MLRAICVSALLPLLVLVALVAGSVLLPSPASATVHTVTNCGDTTPGGAAGQLRRLINDAAPEDVIRIPVCTIVLTGAAGDDANQTGDLDLTKHLTIQGLGPGRSIVDGGGVDRVFDVRPGASVGLADLTVRNGKADFGGGIQAFGGLELVNVEVAGNQATVAGAGLFVGEPATLTHVTVADNQGASVGGGLHVTGAVTLVNVTISGNQATGDGGGLSLSGAGSSSLKNVTITLNHANSDGSGADKGGGLRVTGGTVVLRDSIVAGNTVGSGGSDPDCAVSGPGTLASRGANLVQQATAGCVASLVAADITGIAPDLGPLADNGGPTRTHALLPGSPAIDAGDGACAPVDQRGVRRPQGAGCDIGAYERTRLSPGRLDGGRLQ